MNIRIAITDDHLMVINGLQKMLEGSPVDIIATYANGHELLQGLEQAQPDVLLLDIQMPGLSGEKLMPELLERYPSLRVLVITGFEDAYYMKNMFQLGALGYILKSSDKQTVLDAIKVVYNYEQYIDPTIREQSTGAIRTTMPHIRKIHLTAREQEVLQMTAEGYSHSEIAEKLLLSKRTIENYRMSLLLKLDVKNVAMLIKKAIALRLIK